MSALAGSSLDRILFQGIPLSSRIRTNLRTSGKPEM